MAGPRNINIYCYHYDTAPFYRLHLIIYGIILLLTNVMISRGCLRG